MNQTHKPAVACIMLYQSIFSNTRTILISCSNGIHTKCVLDCRKTFYLIKLILKMNKREEKYILKLLSKTQCCFIIILKNGWHWKGLRTTSRYIKARSRKIQAAHICVRLADLFFKNWGMFRMKTLTALLILVLFCSVQLPDGTWLLIKTFYLYVSAACVVEHNTYTCE